MVVRNQIEVAEAWNRQAQNPELSLIALKSAHTGLNGRLREGLSEVGRAQMRNFAPVVEGAMRVLFERGLTLLASEGLRYQRSVEGLLPKEQRKSATVHAPKMLDVPNFGPQLEDLATMQELAHHHSTNPEDAWFYFESHERERKGEHPDEVKERMRSGLATAVLTAEGRVVLFCGYTPSMTQALEVYGSLSELEALFLRRTDTHAKFELIERVRPMFD